MSDQGSLLSRLDELEREGLTTLESIGHLDQVREFESAWLDKGGRLAELMKGMGAVPHEERGATGKRGSEVKGVLQSALEVRREALRETLWQAELEGRGFDPSLPGPELEAGRMNPVRVLEHEAREYLESLGFQGAEGRADDLPARSFQCCWQGAEPSLSDETDLAPRLLLHIRIAEAGWGLPELRSLLEGLYAYWTPGQDRAWRLYPELGDSAAVYRAGWCPTRSARRRNFATIRERGSEGSAWSASRGWNLELDLQTIVTGLPSASPDRAPRMEQRGR